MPTKEKIAKAKLAALIAEQAKDAESGCILPERITPRKKKHSRPSCLTNKEYGHLLLELGAMTLKDAAKFGSVDAECVSKHRWNLHKKLGPEFVEKWKKISTLIQDVLHSHLTSVESPSSSQEQHDL